eukprot:78718-Pelagomonas_calceolata.AAC.1
MEQRLSTLPFLSLNDSLKPLSLVQWVIWNGGLAVKRRFLPFSYGKQNNCVATPLLSKVFRCQSWGTYVESKQSEGNFRLR